MDKKRTRSEPAAVDQERVAGEGQERLSFLLGVEMGKRQTQERMSIALIDQLAALRHEQERDSMVEILKSQTKNKIKKRRK